MKSDVIHVTNGGAGVREARGQAERVAAFISLEKKDALHLCLLTEEMMGMMQALTGEVEGEFWIECVNGDVSLHQTTKTYMNAEMRQKLLSASSSGKNVAAKGIMGKIKDVFQRLMEPADGVEMPYAALAQVAMPPYHDSFAPLDVCVWSLEQYRVSQSTRKEPKSDWDELEKSIVSKLADEVQVGIIDKKVELIIYKSFK